MKVTLTKQKKQVAILYASSIIGLFLGVIISVINTRSLDPVSYGDVRYVQNLIQFISSLLLFGFFVSGSRLLALSKDESYSRRIRGAMCTLLGGAMVIVSIVMMALFITTFFTGAINMRYLYLAAVPLGGNVLLLNYINTTAQGDNHIGRIAIARLVPSLLYILIAGVIYYYYGATPVLMLVLYNGIALLVLAQIIMSTKPSFSNLKDSFRVLNEENKKYGFHTYLGSLTGVSTQYIAGITLGHFCLDNSEVGFYTLALTMATPLTMLPTIVGTTYFKRFATEYKISKKVILASVGITLISLMLFVVFIDLIVSFLYNDSYKVVAHYASFLAIATSVHGIGDMFNRFLGAHGKGKEIRNAAFITGGIMVVGSIVLVYYYQVQGAIFTRCLSSTAYMSTIIYYYLKITKSLKDDESLNNNNGILLS